MAKKKMYQAAARIGRSPTHPGALLREDVLPAMHVTVSQAAADLRVSRQLVHRILAEKAGVSADMAVRLGAPLRGGGIRGFAPEARGTSLTE